jgi:hypothetical protein
MTKVNRREYLEFVNNNKDYLSKDEIKGKPMSVTQYKDNRGTTMAQKIQFPKSTIYQLRSSFVF